MSEDDLRARFQALRRDEAGGEPSYTDTVRRARSAAVPRALPGRPLVSALGGAAIAAMLILAWQIATPPAAEPAFEPGRWRVPSDALLQGLPGADLLHELPSIGEPVVDPEPIGRFDPSERRLA